MGQMDILSSAWRAPYETKMPPLKLGNFNCRHWE
jgi:hypothetical protein